MDLPPRDVPEGLSPNEYYLLGIQYKSMGWTEQARDAMLLAVEHGPDSDIADSARRFLKTKIPRFPVPLLAEQKNIEGFNQMAIGDTEAAKQTFEELIQEFPDFEWPYGNLSALYLQEGETKRAKDLVKIALEINPDYVNGWLRLATVHTLEHNISTAKDCIDRALNADPADPAALAMKMALDQAKD